MTKLEYKCIELIIDKYTEEVSSYYGDYKEINGEDINKIKKEIKELVNEDESH